MKKIEFFLISILGLSLMLCRCIKQNESVIPRAGFSVADTLVHVGENISLKNLSDSTSVLYFWNFGDGFLSYERNPTHAYSSSGDYVIKLRTSYGGQYLDSTFHNVRVGEQFVYGISIYHVSAKKWYPDDNLPWDPDSTGINSLPDLFVEIKEADSPPLFESNTVYNVDDSSLPLYFPVPDIKINSYISGQVSTEIGFYDRDGANYELMTSNQCSGSNETIKNYDKTNHIGEFSIEFLGCSMLVKYKIK